MEQPAVSIIETEPEPEGEKKMPLVIMERVQRILDTTEQLNDKKKLNNEEYVNLCEDICKIRNKINFVKLKKMTIITSIYYKNKNRTCCGDDEGISYTNKIQGNLFSHDDKRQEDSDDETECCEKGDLVKMVVSNDYNLETIVLRVEEIQQNPYRDSIGSTYIEENALKVMKSQGMLVRNNAIYSFISYM